MIGADEPPVRSLRCGSARRGPSLDRGGVLERCRRGGARGERSGQDRGDTLARSGRNRGHTLALWPVLRVPLDGEGARAWTLPKPGTGDELEGARLAHRAGGRRFTGLGGAECRLPLLRPTHFLDDAGLLGEGERLADRGGLELRGRFGGRRADDDRRGPAGDPRLPAQLLAGQRAGPVRVLPHPSQRTGVHGPGLPSGALDCARVCERMDEQTGPARGRSRSRGPTWRGSAGAKR